MSADVAGSGLRADPQAGWLAAAVSAGGLEIVTQGTYPDVSVAERNGLRCLVHGFVYGLPSQVRRSPAVSAAEQVLDAYEQLGEAVLDHVKGFFSFVLWDPRRELFLAVRDPLGIHPLFHAQGRDGLLLAPSTGLLLARPDVPRTVNRAALADHLRHQWPRPEETFFEAVTRVCPGHALTLRRGAQRTWRYWDPLFPGRDPEWVDESELGRFDDLLSDSVARLLAQGRPGLFLSGGLDSVAIGALAADEARRVGSPLPLGLSVDFPGEYSERDVQAGVARQLQIPQTFVGLDEIVGDDGLVGAAFRAGGLSAPLQNPWLPAYSALASTARSQGCEVVLTGSGGDEWLTVTPLYGADLIRSLRLTDLVRLTRAQTRSYDVTPWLLARNMAWRFGARPLLAHHARETLRRHAPSQFRAHVVRSAQSGLRRRPWLAPDPELRQQLLDRDEELAELRLREQALLPTSGPREYFRQCREAFTHPLVSMEAEEVFEYSRSAGVRILHPYWDTSLVEFLHAVPPLLLNQAGRSKGLIRQMLARRFPALGFERQRKRITASLFGQIVVNDAPQVWRQVGGARTLASLGVVDDRLAAPLYDLEQSGYAAENAGAAPDHQRTDPMWEILVSEGWMRAREGCQ